MFIKKSAIGIFMTLNFYILLSLFIIGSCLASFFICIIENPIKGFSLKERSKCDYCNKVLQTINLIPIFSYICQKGTCNKCNKKINIYYLVSEISMGLCLPLIWFINSNQNMASQIITILIMICFFYTIFLDWQKMLISIPTVILILFFSIVLWCVKDNFNNEILLLKLLGLFFGYFSLWFINKLYKFIRKREGIGDGDPYLFGAIGFFLNIEFLFITLTISAICGAIYGLLLIKFKQSKISDPIPFGSFLGLGTIITYIVKTLYS
jgi:leader peptidase (prepilin peptidase) / N-methyltransferase